MATGLYFTDSKEVAEYYRETTKHKAFDLATRAKELGIDLNAGGRAEIVRQARVNDDSKVAARKVQYANIAARSIPVESLASLIDEYKQKGQGKLYQVELAPKQDEYLLWDKPLSEQSEKVKGSLKTFIDSEKKQVKCRRQSA